MNYLPFGQLQVSLNNTFEQNFHFSFIYLSLFDDLSQVSTLIKVKNQANFVLKADNFSALNNGTKFLMLKLC